MDDAAKLRQLLATAVEYVETGADAIEEVEGSDIDGECAEAREFARRCRVALGQEQPPLRLWQAKSGAVAIASSAQNALGLLHETHQEGPAHEVTADPLALEVYENNVRRRVVVTLPLAAWLERERDHAGYVGRVAKAATLPVNGPGPGHACTADA